jgi:hypothetical protein
VREGTQRLARLYERKLAALEALKKLLLHQAFTGGFDKLSHRRILGDTE